MSGRRTARQPGHGRPPAATGPAPPTFAVRTDEFNLFNSSFVSVHARVADTRSTATEVVREWTRRTVQADPRGSSRFVDSLVNMTRTASHPAPARAAAGSASSTSTSTLTDLQDV